MSKLRFNILKEDKGSKARLGLLETAHGVMETPIFMPVGTRAAVKTLTSQQLLEMDVQAIVANTYHLMLRPGIAVIEKAGGLHRFMNWSRSLVTDSGGFQARSLVDFTRVTKEGVLFKSHIDGSSHFLGPQKSLEIQQKLGADIVMAFDDCSFYSTYEKTREALERTHQWAAICRDCALQPHQNLFAIIQGGTFANLRRLSAQTLSALPFEGFALGGLAIGLPAPVVNAMIEASEPYLPSQKPRYLMGAGTPRNIIEAVMRGIDIFDCVLPTRNARHGTAFTWSGKIHIKAGRYAEDFTSLDPQLDGYPSRFTKAYIRHLMNVSEITGLILVSLQNIAFYLDFMRHLRQAIREDTLMNFYQKVCTIYPV